MASRCKPSNATRTLRHSAGRMFGLLASLKLAVILILFLAAVLAAATFLEAARGREYAQWYVYKSSWLIALLALLGVNILACTLARSPRKMRNLGFLITHAGLLVLLAGSIQTFMYGIEGQLTVAEGETADTILMTNRSQFTILWTGGHGQDGHLPGAFIFRPGPVDWPDGKALDLGTLDDVRLEIVKFLRHARTEEKWVRDESDEGRPVVKFALAGPDGSPIAENRLVGDMFGAEVYIGPVKFGLQEAAVGTMVEDFCNPPSADAMDKEGVLSMHYDGQVKRIAVSENVGKKVALGEEGIAVRIEEYLPNARPDARGRFTSEGDEPGNPVLELRIHVPDREDPIRQIAFAQHPFLSLDGIHGWSSPVKFWYHHPKVTPEPGTEFLQTPDGKLHCRVGIDGAYQSRGEVKPGEQIETAGKFKVAVLEHLPSARKEVAFRSIRLAGGETAGPEAAVLAEVSAGGTTRQVWFKRADSSYGFQRLETPQGPLAMAFGYERLPLEFSLKLLDFERGTNPGRMGDASFASSVRLIDKRQKIDQEHKISMNQPLVHGKFTFYQSGFQDLADGSQATVLSVAYDPGWVLKYLGSLMICLGIFATYYMRMAFFRKLFCFRSKGRTAAESPSPDEPSRESSDSRAGGAAQRRSPTVCAPVD